MKYKPKRSIVFCSWGSEEHGLIGSEEFVEGSVPLESVFFTMICKFKFTNSERSI